MLIDWPLVTRATYCEERKRTEEEEQDDANHPTDRAAVFALRAASVCGYHRGHSRWHHRSQAGLSGIHFRRRIGCGLRVSLLRRIGSGRRVISLLLLTERGRAPFEASAMAALECNAQA